MSSPTDQQLIQYIGQGRRDALAQLFDRYSADLYDYLARLVGDRDQAARLLDQVMLRVPGAAAGFQARDSVRGWLYSLAREAGLDWLRQRGWLDGLPPSDEPMPPGLVGDVWKAARAMPGFFRAVLITEELQPLSPTEKARALGVNRTDLARLIEEARKSFNRIYDAQARAEGRPTSDRINTDTVWNARRRLPVEEGSLFGFLPLIEFPDSLKQQIRRHVLEAMTPSSGIRPTPADVIGAPVASTPAPPAEPPASPPPAAPVPVLIPAPEPHVPPRRTTLPPYEPPPRDSRPFGNVTGLPSSAIAALIGIALALLICGGVFAWLQSRSRLEITSVQPPNGATIQQAPEINVFAVYAGTSEVDRVRTTMEIDGRAVVPLFVNNSVAWTGLLDVGSHVVSVRIVDRASNVAEQKWSFFVLAIGTPIPTPTGGASVTPIVPLDTVTPIVPVTSQIVTVTPIVVPQTPTVLFPTATAPFPTAPPVTQCNRGGVSGVVFNDLNGNGFREPNEPGLAGVTISLATQLNSIVAVTISDTFGNYRFSDIPFGNYRVIANTPSGWSATTATNIPVFIGGCGIVSGFNFGFVQQTVATSTFTPTFPPSFAVTNANAFVTPSFSTTCPQTFTFNGTITTNGAGSVSYRWVRSDGTLRPVQTLPFAFAGTQNVAPDTWTLNANFVGWARIEVLSPNPIVSPTANFSLNCAAPMTPTFTPTFTPTLPPFAVTNVTSSVTPNSSTTCPQTFTFDGTITTNDAGNVTYQWIRSDGASGPPQVLTFLSAGTQNVATETWTLGAPGFNTTGWARIQVTTPNSISSPQANFTLNCPPPTLSPTPTPTDTPLPPSQVTNVTIDPASPLVLNACPGAVNFTGQITTDGPTNVTYEWEQSDGTTVGPLAILFPGPGSLPVNHTWNFGAPPIILNGLWARINVLSPNALSSTQATFDVNCP